MAKSQRGRQQACHKSRGIINEPLAEAVTFPVVGIGASAGGLAAFEAFFSGMPADREPDMAFVLVQHLAPDHKSFLSDLIRRYTRMQVFEVEDGMRVLPNCVYIIAPNYDMVLLQGALHLLEPSAPRGQRLPIDYFFESLASEQRELAICVVLSGTGSDGTLGVRAVKEVGGMAMAQNAESCEFEGMPRSAMATGVVDYELPPAEMPAQLMTYVTSIFGKPPSCIVPLSPTTEGSLKKIFVLLRTQTGHDFSQYKPSTIYRRIARRMAVHQVETIDAYLRYLQQTPPEVDALFADLLIGVTNFFRDPEAFQVLEDQVIPTLFTGRPSDTTVRVWSVGCSTGEEAYSLAILLVERMEALKQSYIVQVFATDIDARAIATARAGVYPASIAADLSPERLSRFFTVEPGGQAYRIHKGIRDLLVFSEQDLIKDPPFSRIDLISCRNLLIYLDANLQKRLLPLFHFALNPDGMLFLGSAEGIGDFEGLFAVLDRKAKLYRRKKDLLGAQRSTPSRFIAPILATDASLPSRGAHKAVFAPKLPLRELMEQALLNHIAPASALVHASGDLVYLYGRTGMYLEPTAGEAGVQNILNMARDGLRPGLSTALRQAVTSHLPGVAPNLRVKTNGHFTQVNVSVHPLASASPGALAAPLYLILLEEAPPPAVAARTAADPGVATASEAQSQIQALTQELRAKDEYLRSTHEELESSNEELKSSNEEMQSVNEELQSTNEELETSKEELQSVNEELATVNTELQSKLIDLSRSYSDMNNLLAGTDIATVFVDFQLRILRFTPTATSIINLIASDLGRPVAHIVSNLLGYTALVADTQAVLATLIPKEADVQTLDGQWYTLRIMPYRTLNNVIEGAVITFVNITDIVKTRAALARAHAELESANEMLERTGQMAKVGGWEMDLVTKVVTYSKETTRIHEIDYPFVPPKLSQGNACYSPEAWAIVRAAGQTTIALGTPYDLELPFITAKGRAIWVRVQGFAVQDKGKTVKLRGTIQDITERKNTDEALCKANRLLRLAVVVRDAHDAITVQDLTGRTLAWNPGAVRLYGWTEAQALAMNVHERIPENKREGALDRLTRLSRAEVLEPDLTQRLTATGAVLDVSIISTALLNETGTLYAIATTERAATEITT